MRAIRVHQFGGPEVLKFEEISSPQPGAGEVLIKVQTIGVNPVETYIRSGANPKLKLPYTPGTDAVGTIAALGEGVEGLAPGDRVYTSGTITGAYAEFTVAKQTSVHRLPESISFTQGAAVNIPYATAYRALFQRARARIGESVLIHGASGGVGLAAVQWGKAAGLQVIGTAGSDEGRIVVLNEGAQSVLDHRQTGYLNQLLELTNGKGVDVIIEMLSNVNLGHDLSILAPRGRVVIVGSRGKVEINPRDAMAREADILGLMLFNATSEELREIHASIYRGLSEGFLRPIIGREFALADAAKAHTTVMESGARGKIVLVA
jgi:NADPH2:quinone reductase